MDETRAGAGAPMWHRTKGVPIKSAEGWRTDRTRAALDERTPPVKRLVGRMTRKPRKSGDVPLVLPVDPGYRFVWQRPDTSGQDGEARRKRRRGALVGRELVSPPPAQAWIGANGAVMSSVPVPGWIRKVVRVDGAEPVAGSWHRAPPPRFGDGPRPAGHLSARPPVRNRVVTPRD